MKRTTILLVVITLLLLAGSALAMSSQNFRLDWFTPMTGAGGGPASSAHFAANFTVGQTVVGASASEHYGSSLGYWYDSLTEFIRNFLPQVVKY
jgi:hypothetical protein